MPHLFSNTMSLVGGVAAGAVAMYLLDPDSGQDRRRDVVGTVNDAVASTRAAFGTTVAGASDSAHSVANTIGRYAKQLAHQASDAADDLTDSATGAVASARKAAHARATEASESAHGIADAIGKYAKQLASRVRGHVSDARGAVSDAADNATEAVRSAHASAQHHVADATDSARAYGQGVYNQAKATHDDWMDRASTLFGRAKAAGQRAAGVPEPHPVATAAGLTAGGVGVLALGVGLMYYLDPERGHSRRALLRDKVYSVARRSGDKVRRYGHHLGNKAHGYAAQAKDAVPEAWMEKMRAVRTANSESAD